MLVLAYVFENMILCNSNQAQAHFAAAIKTTPGRTFADRHGLEEASFLSSAGKLAWLPTHAEFAEGPSSVYAAFRVLLMNYAYRRASVTSWKRARKLC